MNRDSVIMSSAPAQLVLLGPTCSWKSSVALTLAERFGAEVISCDSMQIYRGLDVGTAKVSLAERLKTPHHLVDELDISEPYDVNRFTLLARAAATAIRARGRKVIIVGGTGLYARALIYGFELLPASPPVFARLEQELARPGGREALLARLQKSAAPEEVPADVRLNPRRLVRACEVLELTGQVPWKRQRRKLEPDPDFAQFCLLPQLAMLKERIRARTAAMLAQGWLEEAKQARDNGLLSSPTAHQALGYRDVIDFLEGRLAGGLSALEEVIANRTIQYARRQLTWFKHQHPGAVKIPINPEDTPPTCILEAILRQLPPGWHD